MPLFVRGIFIYQLTSDAKYCGNELDKLIRDNISNADVLPSGKIEIELPLDVGIWKSIDGKTIEKTNRVTVHRSKTGYHAVPARKKNRGK